MSELEKYQQIFERDPTDLQAFNNVCRAAEKAQDYEYLTELLKYRTQITGDQAEIVDLLFRAGVVYLEKINDVARGVEVLLQAFEIDQAHAGIGARLENAYIEAGDFEAALAIIEGRINAVGSADVAGTQMAIRSDLHLQAGELLQDRMGDSERALIHYRKAIELDKTNAGALSRAREIYLGLSKFKNAAKLCELEARLEKNTDRKVALYRELADILGNRMNDITQAVTALKRALKADQNNEDIKLDLAETIANSSMDPAHAKDHKWAADFLTKRAKHVAGEEGLRLACMAIRAYPTSEKALAVGGARARETLDFASLINECKSAYATLNSVDEQAPLIRRIVKSYLRMGSMPDALMWAEKLEPVATDKDRELIAKLREASSAGPMGLFDSEVPAAAVSTPGDHDNFGFATSSRTSMPAAPAPVSEPPELDVVSVSLDPPDDMSLSEWIDKLHHEAESARRVGDDDHAEQYMRAIVTHQPGDQRATTFLERRYRGRDDWASLRDLLLQCVHSDDFPPAVKTVRLRQAAKLAEENLNDVNGAIDTWYQIKAHDPKVRDARDALERLLAETERWEELTALYKEEIEGTSSRSKKVAAWQRLADIYDNRLNDAMSAAVAYNHIIELAPDDEQAVDALEELYEREKLYDQLVPLLDKRAESSRDKLARKTLILRAARVLEEHLGLFEEAYQKAESVLEFLPGDLEAIETMEFADEKAENYERMIETLNLKARVSKIKKEKVAAYKKVAVVSASRLEDPALSLKAWNKVLEVDPTDNEALDTTVGLYESAGEWNELVRILDLRIEHTEDKAEKIALHRRLAAVLEDELENPSDAILHWKRILDIEEDVAALGALARWYETQEDWNALADVLARLAPMVEDNEAKSDVLFRRAELYYNRLGQKEKAIRELKEISSGINPNHVPTLGLLRDVLAEDGKFEEAADVLEQQITYTKDTDALRSFYILLGEWSRDKLSDSRRAIAAYEKAAAMDISDEPLLDRLDELFVETEEWDKLLKMMYGRFQRSDDNDIRYGILLRGGTLCEEKLEDKQQAWGWYRQIFENMRNHEGAMAAVEEAGHRMGLWKELVDLFGVMTKEGNDDEKVQWWLKISAIFEEKLEEPNQALEAVLRAFGLDPDNEEMLDSVDRLAVNAQAWDRLSTVYSVLAKREDDAEGKIEKLLRHAKLLYEKGDESGMAFDVALKAFELDPTSEEMLSFVEEVGRAALRFDDMVKVFKVCSDRSEGLERKVELLLKAATMHKDNLDDGDSALVRALDALTLSPFDSDIVTQVWAFVRSLEADLLDTQKGIYWQKVIDVYRHMVEIFRRETPKQVELTLVISKIYAEELHEKSLAFEALKDAQQLAPQDENTIDKLEVMAGELGMWDDVVEHYRDILDDTFEMSTAVMYHRRRARILSEFLERKEEAAEHYWQIIQLDAQDVRAYESLLNYYEGAGKWNDLVNLLERQLDAASDDDKRRALLLQIADIWENNIGNKYEAKDWYGQVVALWPDDASAREGLERLASMDKVGGYEDDAELQELVSIAPPPPEVPKESAVLETDDLDESDTTGEDSRVDGYSTDASDGPDGEDEIATAAEESDDFDEIEESGEKDALSDDDTYDEHMDDDDESADDFESDESTDENLDESKKIDVLNESEESEESEELEESEESEESKEDAGAEVTVDDDAESGEVSTDEEGEEVEDDEDGDQFVGDSQNESDMASAGESEEESEEESETVDVMDEAGEHGSTTDADMFFGGAESGNEDENDNESEDSDDDVADMLDEDLDAEEIIEDELEEASEDDVPAPPRPPVPPRVSVAPSGGTVAPPPPPPPVSGMPRPPAVPSIPAPPGVPGVPRPPMPPGPPSVPSVPSIPGTFAPPAPPKPKS
ncbi:MAG: hypothetical protein JXX14_03365 [Deltaproteobacteria bacterium]|nr:hypothetical protein [Deltaproteobacteria bacterium]